MASIASFNTYISSPLNLASLPITYDIKDMKETSNTFHEKLSVFKELKIDEKIYIRTDDILVKDTGYPLIPLFVSRWIGNQSRENLLEYLKNNLKDYLTFLNMLISASKWNSSDANLIELKENNYKFLTDIEEGLSNIKETYCELNDLHVEIDNATKEFIDFKILVEKYRNNDMNVSID